MSRTARPIVALARLPGPNRFTSAFIPISSATGPLTIRSGAEPPVLAVDPWKLNSGLSMASNAASRTGKYSGRHPAMTGVDRGGMHRQLQPGGGMGGDHRL